MAFNQLAMILDQVSSLRFSPLTFEYRNDGRTHRFPGGISFQISGGTTSTDERWEAFRAKAGGDTRDIFVTLSAVDFKGQDVLQWTRDRDGPINLAIFNEDLSKWLIFTVRGVHTINTDEVRISNVSLLAASEGFMLADGEVVMYRAAAGTEVALEMVSEEDVPIVTVWCETRADSAVLSNVLVSGEETQDVTALFRLKYASIQHLGNNGQIQQRLTGEAIIVDKVRYDIESVAFVGRRQFVEIGARLAVVGT